MSRPLTVSFFGVTIPIPHWTVGGFGIVALAGVSGTVYHQVFPAAEILSPADTLAREEYERHLFETPNTIYERDGLTLRVYDDHCLLIATEVPPRKVLTKLVPSLARKELSQASSATRQVGSEAPSPWRLPSLLTTTVHAQGRCQNPHPGEFQTSYGNKNGCWVEVLRRWPDGCAHVQMLNTCSGAWDANADGSPRVRWTQCRH
ncbi:MAG TPA: hypothetical protein VFP85_05405 [Vicinamibacterales bacterium]|nr:hypothetical protein [Vicinamibacterales bacterium]